MPPHMQCKDISILSLTKYNTNTEAFFKWGIMKNHFFCARDLMFGSLRLLLKQKICTNTNLILCLAPTGVKICQSVSHSDLQ